MKNINGDVNWGILGCGDVCEIKSGPAFNKIPHSKLVAVMRRNEAKAQDYAKRHGVPKWYSDAQDLINDPEVNAVYIATPPASHEELAIAAMKAGKPVYIEKPLAIDVALTQNILDFAKQKSIKATGAYYRRRLPLFEKAKEIIESGVLGDISLISIRLLLPPAHYGIAQTEENWRINPDISGGGLFYDLAPHMLDIIYWIFGVPTNYTGKSFNQKQISAADDFTYLNAEFENKVILTGQWAFNVSESGREDTCQIIGDRGSLKFSFFELNPLEVRTDSDSQSYSFTNPENVQLNLIRDTVKYFRGAGENPCSVSDALVSMKMIEAASR